MKNITKNPYQIASNIILNVLLGSKQPIEKWIHPGLLMKAVLLYAEEKITWAQLKYFALNKEGLMPLYGKQ